MAQETEAVRCWKDSLLLIFQLFLLVKYQFLSTLNSSHLKQATYIPQLHTFSIPHFFDYYCFSKILFAASQKVKIVLITQGTHCYAMKFSPLFLVNSNLSTCKTQEPL